MQSYLDNEVISPGDLCMVAINGGDQDGFGGLSGVLERALYPNRTKTWGDRHWMWGPPGQIVKSNGSHVSASVFVRANYRQITGVIFSPSAIGNLAGLAEDFHYFPNPNCDLRLEPRWVQWTREYVLYESPDDPLLIEIEHSREIARVLGPFPSLPVNGED